MSRHRRRAPRDEDRAHQRPPFQQNKRGLSGIAAADAAGLDHRRLADMSELADHPVDLARREVGLIVVSGGDGTVQAVLTALLERRPFARLPLLALLPSGMTNLTAADAGFRGRPRASIARLARLAKDGPLVQTAPEAVDFVRY